MKTNEYYEKLNAFRTLLSSQVIKLFHSVGNKFLLQLGQYNLLKRSGNCIESSTALGFILEEFIVSKLEEHSETELSKKFSIHSYSDGTSTRSYDCYAEYQHLKILINVKVEQIGSRPNDAVAAINRLVQDYCLSNGSELAYLVLKVRYDFVDTESARSIIIVDEPILRYLEEFDYSREHMQDNRVWSEAKKTNNGRLQLTARFIRDNKMPIHSISHKLTKQQLKQLNTKEASKDRHNRMTEDVWPQE